LAAIQTAVDYAVDGCVIAVTAGVYTASTEYTAVRIRQGVRLRGTLLMVR